MIAMYPEKRRRGRESGLSVQVDLRVIFIVGPGQIFGTDILNLFLIIGPDHGTKVGDIGRKITLGRRNEVNGHEIAVVFQLQYLYILPNKTVIQRTEAVL